MRIETSVEIHQILEDQVTPATSAGSDELPTLRQATEIYGREA